MSRYRDWINAESGIINWLEKQGFELDIRNTKGKKDRYLFVEIRKIVLKYRRFKKLKCSHSTMVLLIQKDFNDFKDFINNNDFTFYKTFETK